MKTQRLWKFVEDMNFDGAVTYRDVLLWVKWLFFYPGDGFLYFIINKTPDVAGFFEITELSYGGFLSGFISVLFWLFLYWIYAYIRDGIKKEQDRRIMESLEIEKIREEEDARLRQEAYKNKVED